MNLYFSFSHDEHASLPNDCEHHLQTEAHRFIYLSGPLGTGTASMARHRKAATERCAGLVLQVID